MERKIGFSKEEEEWINEYYPFTTNNELCKRLGCGKTKLLRYAKKNGLKKTRTHILNEKIKSIEKARESNRILGYPAKNTYIKDSELGRKKGLAKLLALSKDKDWQKIRAEKTAKTLREIYKQEKRRILFGLPQETKYRLVRTPAGKVNVRSKMRKKGYIAEKMGNTIYYTNETKRSLKQEDTAKKWGLKVIPIECA